MSSSSQSLVQSASNLTRNVVSRTPSQPSLVATATSILPSLNLTPNKNTTSKPSTSTPQQQPSPAPSTPGAWQHPRMDEVIRRQNAVAFDSSNVRTLLLSLGLMLGVFYTPQYITPYIPSSLVRLSQPYASYTTYAILALLTLNIAVALAPLLRPKDACEDIPLTPHQRALLGLPPMSRPATPQEEAAYATPPRYSRSATPVSATSSAGSFADSLRVNARGSPVSGRGSPLDGSIMDSGLRFSSPASAQRAGSGSPAYAGSPLPGRMFENSRRRGSMGSGRSSPMGEFEGLSASPAKSNRASVGLNSKWLYEKGRGSPQVMGNGWGTGSVFN